MFTSFNHFSQDLVLLVSGLDRVKQDASVQHPEVRTEVLCKRVIPVFEFRIRPTWRHLAGTRLHLVSRVIELVLRSESSVELALEVRHKSSVTNRLSGVVPELPVLDGAGVSIVGVTPVASLASELIGTLSVVFH